MSLNVYNQTDYRGYLKYQKEFRQILKRTREVLKLEGKANVSVILTNDDQIQQINRDYRKIDRPTDVISFAYHDADDEENPEELGDIFINIDAVLRQAESYGHSNRREICFLFTHGLLHLCGYDHMTPEDEKEMFDLQHEILDELVPRNG